MAMSANERQGRSDANLESVMNQLVSIDKKLDALDISITAGEVLVAKVQAEAELKVEKLRSETELKITNLRADVDKRLAALETFRKVWMWVITGFVTITGAGVLGLLWGLVTNVIELKVHTP